MPQVLDIEQAVLLLEIEPPFDKRDIQLARRRLAKQWHPDIAPPGKQLEHERHLKAINEAADQLEQLAEESRGGKVSRNAVKVSAAGRAQAPRRGGRARLRRGAAPARRRTPTAPSTTRSPRACPTTRSCTATRAASPIPSGASAASTASTSPATATTSSSGRASRFQRRHPHGAGRLAAVRRLLQARPGRRARAALHDRRQARARRGRLQARRAAARLRARRRAAQHRGAAAADDSPSGRPGDYARRRARRARLDPRGARAPGAVPLRRAHLRGHGLALAGASTRRERETARAPRDAVGVGAARPAAAARASTARARARRSSARARSAPTEQGLLDLALVAHLLGDVGAEVSRLRAGDASSRRSPRPRGRATRTRSRAPTASRDCLAACERALALADDPEVRDLRDQVLARRAARARRGLGACRHGTATAARRGARRRWW